MEPYVHNKIKMHEYVNSHAIDNEKVREVLGFKIHHMAYLEPSQIETLDEYLNKPLRIQESLKFIKADVRLKGKPDWITDKQWLSFGSQCYKIPAIMAQKDYS